MESWKEGVGEEVDKLGGRFFWRWKGGRIIFGYGGGADRFRFKERFGESGSFLDLGG